MSRTRPFRTARLGAAAALLAALGCGATPEPAEEAADAASVDPFASAPTPRLPDGHPDLNGTWAHAGGGVFGLDFVQPETLPDGSVCVFGCGDGEFEPAASPFPAPEVTFPEYQNRYLARVEELRERQVELDTVLRCYPPGVPRIGPPDKIVQTATEVVFLYHDYNGSYYRIVPTDGRPHRAGLPRSYLGDAIGRFEAGVLVVETVNFTEETWLTDNGAFHTADLRVVERLRRVGNTIEYEAVAHDPAVLDEPWQAREQTLWLADEELEEPVPCEERDLDHMVDGSYHENPR